ncbi:MAG: ABC transporter ATP-binding protein [Candidatus Latescibacteria bacterium]|nr:ABC transporter ATP-binding protein [Candidatus Latescibacterota bacterium]
MESAFEVKNLTKTFGDVTALDSVSVSVPGPAVVGLIGRNGSGKTTLLRHVIGLYLPTSGECTTLGCPSDKLGPGELSRIGVVHQENRFLEWMKVEQQLRYVSTFYKHWDRDLEERLLDELELDPSARVGTLSPGNAQKLGIILAVCHRPDLLILDEPISGLDPITREQFLRFLLELLQQDANTIVISSHVLHDVEKVINRVICLDRGRTKADASLDDLQERFAEWRVTVKAGRLPAHFEEDFVISREGDSRQARLLVKGASDNLDAFKAKYGVDVASSQLNLEQMFPLLLQETG